MKLINVLLLLINLFALSFSSNSQPEKYESVFLYQFTRYVEWPNNDGDFIIGIYGESKIKSFLDAIASSKKVGNNRNIVIKQFNNVGDIGKCHILFVPDSQKANLSAIVNNTKKGGILIVTESPGLLKDGSCINYLIANDKVNFEINKKNIADQNLKISESLAKLAVATN